ncbi:MAG: YggS family pyridoxal phosphate-dependent enzyme [Methylobacteriaceae bacterium]|jgi:pyridoxal phosphate enzyme (YggS family)|nr:YggS family pyridoxal phosphate-dependent enzyme [Methylobacteriaceae bacterium]
MGDETSTSQGKENGDILRGLEDVESRLARCCADTGRRRADITLIAVSKTFPFSRIAPALKYGQRAFGENYVQEATEKWLAPKAGIPGLALHMIGPLQSNKARQAVALFDCIHTLDRDSLAKALAKELAAANRAPRLLVQVNTGEESQKGGVFPAGLAEFLKQCREEYGLTVSGLMCIPPVDEPPSPHFALLAKLAERHDLPDLSMGMSDDFEAAVRMGATHIRIGSAIFGARTYPAKKTAG